MHVLGGGLEGVGVGRDDAVREVHDAICVLLRKFRVVRNHDDQTIVGDLGEQVHDLNARFGIERAGGLVCQQDLGVVDKRAGDGDALHLTAGKLAGALVDVVAEADLLQRLDGTLLALLRGDAGKRQGELDVGEYALMGDEVVALEHEADAVVAVGVPIAVFVLVGGHAVDDHVARVVMIEAADDVEQRGLARAGRTEDGYELVVAEGDGNVVEGFLREVARSVGLADVLYLQHARAFRGWCVWGAFPLVTLV